MFLFVLHPYESVNLHHADSSLLRALCSPNLARRMTRLDDAGFSDLGLQAARDCPTALLTKLCAAHVGIPSDGGRSPAVLAVAAGSRSRETR